MSDVVFVKFDCVRCEAGGEFKINIDNLRSSSSPLDDTYQFIEDIDPQMAARLGQLIITYVVAMADIADTIDWDNNSEQEGRCPNCGRKYTEDDLSPEDDPAFQFVRS